MLVFFMKRGRENTAEHARMFGTHPDTQPAVVLRSSPADLDRLAVSTLETEDVFVTIPRELFKQVLEDARTAHTLAARLMPRCKQAVHA